MKNTELELRYSDAAGYKSYATVVLDGAITQAQIDTIRSHLEGGESVIADQVGLPTPAESFSDRYDFPTEDDHVWTEVVNFADDDLTPFDLLTDDDDDGLMSVEEFVKRISEVTWDIGAEMARLGIPA